MKRSISSFGLLLTSISAIIGSGWLFSAFFTAEHAGPAAPLAWIIGGISIIFIAFIFAELCAMLPVSGSSVRIPHYTHGTVVSFLFSWMIWLSYLALMAIEVQAVVQYAHFYFPTLLIGQSGQLSGIGYIVAIALMFIVSFLNVYSLRWLIRCNNFLTLLKIVIPLIICIVVLLEFFQTASLFHPAHSPFFSLGIHGVFGALSAGGVLFAFNGFKQAAEMAGEAKNPGYAVPLALIGSILFCMFIYLLLQITFNVSITASNIAGGWQHLALKGGESPFAAIVTQDKLVWLLPLIYTGAIISPFAASLMYCSSSGRSLAGISNNGFLPPIFQEISKQGNPLYAIFFNFIFGICLFAPLPGWGAMMAFLTSLLVVTYSIGPICLLALRYQLPEQKRPLKLPFPMLWSTAAFYICTLLAYFSGWHIISKMIIAIAIGLITLFVLRIFIRKEERPILNWREAIWLWPYLLGLTAISYVGNYDGGLHLFSMKTIFIVIAIFSIVIIMLATKFRLPAEETRRYVSALHLEKQDQIL